MKWYLKGVPFLSEIMEKRLFKKMLQAHNILLIFNRFILIKLKTSQIKSIFYLNMFVFKKPIMKIGKYISSLIFCISFIVNVWIKLNY